MKPSTNVPARFLWVATAAVSLIIASPTPAQQARADLLRPNGDSAGAAIFTQTDSGLVIQLALEHLPAGMHAVHIHGKGECAPPDFESAEGHFNPTGSKHGFLNPKGPHAGDMPNIRVQQNGTAREEIRTQRMTLKKGEKTSLLRKGGTALIIHQLPDDYVTDPAGAAGERIACGVIREAK